MGNIVLIFFSTQITGIFILHRPVSHVIETVIHVMDQELLTVTRVVPR